MTPRELKHGDVVQISPEHHAVERFGACFMVVTEPKSWGAQGYVKNAGEAGLFYMRVKFEDMEFIGRAEWAQPKREDTDNG